MGSGTRRFKKQSKDKVNLLTFIVNIKLFFNAIPTPVLSGSGSKGS